MSIDSLIQRMRPKQADQFSDTVTVSRQVGEITTDPDTGATFRDFDEVYAGPCKIRPAEKYGSDLTTGETQVRQLDVSAKFPVDSDIRTNDVVTVTASTYDAGMVDRQYRVTDVPADAWQIARVAYLEETVVPELHADGS